MLSIITIIILIFSAVLHEVMHGMVAFRLGDPTAKFAGRLTLNPLKHLDPFGSVLLPLSLFFLSGGRVTFAYAKPVPINPTFFRNFRRDTLLTALAGPVTNIAIALLFGLTLHGLLLSGQSASALPSQILFAIVLVNVVLATFNLIPVPPLDGSRVLAFFFPGINRPEFERFGIILVFILVFAAGSALTALLGFVLLKFLTLLGLSPYLTALSGGTF